MSVWHLCLHWDTCVPKFVCKKPRLEPLKQPTYGYKPSLLDHFISRVSTWLDYKWDHFSSKVHGCTKQKWQENTWPLKVHLTDVRRWKILSLKMADSLTQIGVFFSLISLSEIFFFPICWRRSHWFNGTLCDRILVVFVWAKVMTSSQSII